MTQVILWSATLVTNTNVKTTLSMKDTIYMKAWTKKPLILCQMLVIALRMDKIVPAKKSNKKNLFKELNESTAIESTTILARRVSGRTRRKVDLKTVDLWIVTLILAALSKRISTKSLRTKSSCCVSITSRAYCNQICTSKGSWSNTKTFLLSGHSE